MYDSDRPSRSRRRVLAGVVGGLSLAIAGCLDDNGGIDPVSLDGERACDQCGMIVADHPGPVGQIHFDDDEPEDGRPAAFCSSPCTFRYLFDAEDGGREARAVFLTDYSVVDHEVFEDDSGVVFSSHVEASAFARTTVLTVVVGSEVEGAMGPSMIPFSEAQDVEAFLEQYGGDAIGATDVDRGTLEAL